MRRDLIETARRLAAMDGRRPRQADLKRSISTAYYAVFHALARNAADLLVGAGGDRPDKAWLHTYRAIEHGFARAACQQVARLGFPEPIVRCANNFVELQERRHAADYDPTCRIARADVGDAIELAEEAISSLTAAARRDRRAFAIQLLLRRRA